MAGRGRKPGKSCYVYRIFDGCETVYVGKGSGRRLALQMRKFGCDGEKLVTGLSDDDAFDAERDWIKKLLPTANKAAGGNGGRVRQRSPSRAEIEARKTIEEIEREADPPLWGHFKQLVSVFV